MSEKDIYVYADWLEEPTLIGVLHVTTERGRERYSFECNESWLENHADMILDPDIYQGMGRQYPQVGKELFGIFADSCPDRWGRLLMRRREAIDARSEDRKPQKLLESDYLLGVYDETRMGAIRFALEEGGEFQSPDKRLAAPPWATLRQLETASLAFENERDPDEEKWLRQLLAPGSSLGGARPKANVKAPDGSLWIAKFPSKHDEWNSGAWEMVAHDLAKKCGLGVPEAKLLKFSKVGSTYLVKRFDRDGERRLPFASAMTLLGYTDGVDDVSYLELAEFIKDQQKARLPEHDLRELWTRIVFSIAISNTDDHLRNHGFIYDGSAWKLSPLYDVNPNIYGGYLSLCIDEVDSTLDFDLALSVADEFLLSEDNAKEIIKQVTETVASQWQPLAKQYGLSREQILRMQPAFKLATEQVEKDRPVQRQQSLSEKIQELNKAQTCSNREQDIPSGHDDPDGR